MSEFMREAAGGGTDVSLGIASRTPMFYSLPTCVSQKATLLADVLEPPSSQRLWTTYCLHQSQAQGVDKHQEPWRQWEHRMHPDGCHTVGKSLSTDDYKVKI